MNAAVDLEAERVAAGDDQQSDLAAVRLLPSEPSASQAETTPIGIKRCCPGRRDFRRSREWHSLRHSPVPRSAHGRQAGSLSLLRPSMRQRGGRVASQMDDQQSRRSPRQRLPFGWGDAETRRHRRGRSAPPLARLTTAASRRAAAEAPSTTLPVLVQSSSAERPRADRCSGLQAAAHRSVPERPHVNSARDCRFSRHGTAAWRLCPALAVGSGDPGQGPCWENADG